MENKPARRRKARRQRGAMLMLVASLLFNITIVGLFSLNWARTGFYRAVDLERRVQATYLAEAGLNLAFSRVSAHGALSSLELPYELIPSTLAGEGSYSARLLNNPGDPGGLSDSDGVFVIEVTGLSGGQGRRRTLQSYVYVGGADLLTSVPGALGVGEGITGTIGGNALISGSDASGIGDAVAGLSFEKAGQSISVGGVASISGSPDYQWEAGPFVTGSGLSVRMQELIETLSASASAVHHSSGAPSLGTVAAPQITVIDAGSSASFTSSASGAGVLIVRGRLSVTGKFAFSGIVLVEGTAGELSMTSQSVINGALFITPPSPVPATPRDALTLHGGATIRYSRSSLLIASSLVPSLQVRSYVARN